MISFQNRSSGYVNPFSIGDADSDFPTMMSSRYEKALYLFWWILQRALTLPSFRLAKWILFKYLEEGVESVESGIHPAQNLNMAKINQKYFRCNIVVVLFIVRKIFVCSDMYNQYSKRAVYLPLILEVHPSNCKNSFRCCILPSERESYDAWLYQEKSGGELLAVTFF